MQLVPDDTPEQLTAEADHLYEAMEIISRRFPGGKYNDTRLAIRQVASHLLSLSRHPSRRVSPVAAIEEDLGEMRKP